MGVLKWKSEKIIKGCNLGRSSSKKLAVMCWGSGWGVVECVVIGWEVNNHSHVSN
jgi:hypothetical protein